MRPKRAKQPTVKTATIGDRGDADGVGDQCDLVVMFASYHHRAAFKEAADTIRQTVGPTVMLGVTAEGVLGEAEELEGKAGMSALALQLPGARMQPWFATPGRDDRKIQVALSEVSAQPDPLRFRCRSIAARRSSSFSSRSLVKSAIL